MQYSIETVIQLLYIQFSKEVFLQKLTKSIIKVCLHEISLSHIFSN